MQRSAQAGNRLGRRALPEHDFGDVARQQLGDGKDRDGHGQQRQQGGPQPDGNQPRHRRVHCIGVLPVTPRARRSRRNCSP